MKGIFRHVPNLLTGMRLACAPALAFLLMVGADRAALGVFAFAGVSDVVDGYFAKRFGLVTRLGRYLDPAADKLLMLAAFLALTMLGCVPIWLAALVIGRDIAIVAGIVVGHALALPLRVAPLAIGKLCTAIQVCYVGLMLLLLALDLHWGQLAAIAAIATAAITLVSWAAYGAVWVGAFTAKRRREA